MTCFTISEVEFIFHCVVLLPFWEAGEEGTYAILWMLPHPHSKWPYARESEAYANYQGQICALEEFAT